MLKRVFQMLDEFFSMNRMKKLIAALLILYLLIHTDNVWGSWVSMLISIIKPFVYGFAIAYVCHPLIRYLKNKGINPNISIMVMWIVIILAFIFLLLMIVPMLYSKMSQFMSSIIFGVEWISDKIKEIANMKDFSLINSLTGNIINYVKSYSNWMPGLVSTIPSWMSLIIDSLTNSLFTIIISIYMMADFDRIKEKIAKAVSYIFPDSRRYLTQIDEDIMIYLKSMAILVLIRFVEYSLFYYFIGHKDWLIVGILSAFGVIIPYIGGIVANAIGLLTGLTLPSFNLMILIVGIVILSNVDNYVISPIVHNKRSSVGALTSLFAVFAGGIIGNIIGIMISIPLVIAIKAIIEVYDEEHPKGLASP